MHGLASDGPALGVNSDASLAEEPATVSGDGTAVVDVEDWAVPVVGADPEDCELVAAGGAVNAEMTPSSGEATYSAESLALVSRSSDPSKTFAPVHDEPGRGVLFRQPRRVSDPVAGSRANATTLADECAVTNTVRPSALTVTPSAPSRPGVGVHTPLAPSCPSVPSELRQPLSDSSPVVGLRLKIVTVPKLSATSLPATPPTTYTLVPSGETAIALG